MGQRAVHEFLRDAVILSDDAGQFNVGQHAAVLGARERLVHKLNTFTTNIVPLRPGFVG